ncbi:helix-turn-helix domain-containing protein [Nocardia cyriacigeorgica]|uniref:helix-turn-helix domain-containing protein n=1 Tax=Nocardia cyriacigeorgica TaxID=135487 RepID=UPI0018945AAA|nr:helix-turn-helix domain-containing protein [Nocardia cyriacigeorgica]MBF6412888.1 helix-turn-helix domain-containing protein [Nocardia cyriacigeorgica]
MTKPMTPRTAAEVAGCHVNSVYSALLASELKGYQQRAPKGRWRIFPEDLERWMRGEAAAA